MTYDQIQPIKESLRQRMEGTDFITFIAPKNESDFKAFIAKADSITRISDSPINEVLDNPETVRNLLDQVPDNELEIYVKSTKENDKFLGTLDEYRQKYDIGHLHDME